MTWAEAIYKIIIEGGGGLLTAIVILAAFTSFFETVFGYREPEAVEVFPESAKSVLTEVIVEMRAAAREGKHNSNMLADWATRITEVIEEEES
jgi:hypothetical protein